MTYGFFRAGYFEYDKAKPRVEAKCQRCGCDVNRRGKRYCGPCANIRYEENVARNRPKYRGRLYGRAKSANTLKGADHGT